MRTPETTRKSKYLEHEKTNSYYIFDQRPKRGVVQLYNMISCVNECDPFMYKGYGCYCGFLGSGRAVDGIDKYVAFFYEYKVIIN